MKKKSYNYVYKKIWIYLQPAKVACNVAILNELLFILTKTF